MRFRTSNTPIPLSRIDEESRGMKQRLEMSTAEIGLSVRTTNCLEERGIFTVEELLDTTRDDRPSICNFGEKTLEEVYRALERIGFFRCQRVASSDEPEWEVEMGESENIVKDAALAEEGSSRSEGTGEEADIPVGLVRSFAAFRRDLSDLLRQSQGKWVAYHHEKQIGVGGSKTLLYQQCLSMGLSPSDFIVRRVVPDVTRFVEKRPL